MQLTVIGIGTRNACDDAIGLKLVESLAQRLPGKGVSFHLVEQTDAMNLAHDLMELRMPVLIVDCADMGLEPGDCRCFDGRSAVLKGHTHSVSTHGLGMAEALALATNLGFDQAVTVFGIQPFDLSPTSCLSPSMQARFPGLLDALAGSVIEMISS